MPLCRRFRVGDGQKCATQTVAEQVKVHDGGLAFSSMSSFSTSTAVTQKM